MSRSMIIAFGAGLLVIVAILLVLEFTDEGTTAQDAPLDPVAEESENVAGEARQQLPLCGNPGFPCRSRTLPDR